MINFFAGKRKNDKKLTKLEVRMAAASNYDEWLALALEHDRLSGAEDWRHNSKSELYDYININTRLNKLRDLRLRDDDHGLLFSLNEGIHGNMAGMGHADLHKKAKCGTKHLVENYVDEISGSLRHIASNNEMTISHAERVEFYQRASHCYGNTALMLSGGGSLGYFHFGVVKVLIEHKLLPNVISGASAGSFVSAIVGTRTDKEYLDLFESGEIFDLLTENYGELDLGVGKNIDMDMVKEGMARLIPDMTFEEAYKKTGRSINITISPAEPRQTSRLLNHIASPNVTLRSAVLASTALPGVFQPVQLEARNMAGEIQVYLPSRRWIDGSFSQDLPAKRLARMYGANHFIVSQVMPVLGREARGRPGMTKIVKDASVAASKQVIRGTFDFWQRYAKLGPRAATTINALNSLLDQSYSGDINIYPGFGILGLAKVLKSMSREELIEIVSAGEQATWPKIATVRTTTKIGFTLNAIMSEYEGTEAGSLRDLADKKVNSQRVSKSAKKVVKKETTKKSATKKARVKKTATKKAIKKPSATMVKKRKNNRKGIDTKESVRKASRKNAVVKNTTKSKVTAAPATRLIS